MKNKTFFQKVKCAFIGLISAFKSEKSFRYYVFILVATIILNLLLQLPLLCILVNIICALLVFAAECLNTAIEKICDYLTTDYSAQIKFIKDIAASGVLCCGSIYFLIEFLMLGLYS